MAKYEEYLFDIIDVVHQREGKLQKRPCNLNKITLDLTAA